MMVILRKLLIIPLSPGHTLDELKEMVKDAVECHFEDGRSTMDRSSKLWSMG